MTDLTVADAVDAGLALEALIDPAHPVKAEYAAWASEHLAVDDQAERDRDSRFFAAGWQACADKGIMAMTVPVADGGSGTDLVTTLLALEGLGKGCLDNGLGFAVASQMLSFQDAIVRFGSDEQRRRILPPVCRGDMIGAFAITEPESGSDTYALTATARLEGDHYVLDGHKAYITLAPVADVAVVFASTNPTAGRWGVSAFLVHAGQPGVTFAPNRLKMGLRTTPFGDILLDGYRAPVTDRLGAEGAGASIFATCMESERGLIFATQLGAVERIIDEAVAYSRSRHQFGRPIGDFQAVSHRLADMRLRHETARLLLYKAAVLVARSSASTMTSAMAKLHVSEAVAATALDAARVYGAKGYLTEFDVEREVRDALGGLVYSGTSDIQRNIIARLMGVG